MDEKLNKDNLLQENVEEQVEESAIDKKEEARKRLITLYKKGAMCIIAFTIIMLAAIAWFTQVKNIGANGMSVTVEEFPFEIGVKGSTVRNNTEFAKADDTYLDGDTTRVSGYYTTYGGSSQVKIRYTPGANDETVFGPGSGGQIDFYVIPTRDGDLSVQIDLQTVGYRELGEGQTTIKKISELTTANSGLEQSVIDQYKQADELLGGHVLFFEEPGDMAETTLEGSRYHYKKPITTRTLNKTFTNARKNEPQKVTIYWMWANTLGQIALKDNSSGFRSDYPIVQDVADNGTDISATDKGKLIKYLKDNKSTVFMNAASVTDSEIDNAKVKANFYKLSEGYNDADYQIGLNVSYFMVDITVSPIE